MSLHTEIQGLKELNVQAPSLAYPSLLPGRPDVDIHVLLILLLKLLCHPTGMRGSQLENGTAL